MFGHIILNSGDPCQATTDGHDMSLILRKPILGFPLRERLRTHKVFTKDQCFYLNYHMFSIKSYVLDVYQNRLGEAILIHIHNI